MVSRLGYQVHMQGYAPLPRFTSLRKAKRTARALALNQGRVVSVYDLDTPKADLVVRYEPMAGASGEEVSSSRETRSAP